MNYDRSSRLRPFDWIWIIVSVAVLTWAAYAIPSCLMSIGSCGGPWSEGSLNESQRRGDLILAEIARWQSAHGRPPESLKELESKGFSVQPPTAGTKRWRYAVGKDRHFTLAFECKGGYPCMYYYSKNAEWRLDT